MYLYKLHMSEIGILYLYAVISNILETNTCTVGKNVWFYEPKFYCNKIKYLIKIYRTKLFSWYKIFL